MVLARLPESFAVIGDVQWLPGYCVLLTDDPAVGRLTDLPRERRLVYLESVERLSTAVEQACASADPAFRRVNIEILGNTDPYLHTHIFPRYEWEPADIIGGPVWWYPRERWSDPTTVLGPQHDPLRAAIASRLTRTTDVQEDPAPRG